MTESEGQFAGGGLAVILAAAPPRADYPPVPQPACLYHASGRVRLDQTVAALRAAGFGRIRVVIGCGADRVRRYGAEHRRRLGGLELVENTVWASDAAAALERGLDGVDEDVVLVLGGLGAVLAPRAQLTSLRQARAAAVDYLSRHPELGYQHSGSAGFLRAAVLGTIAAWSLGADSGLAPPLAALGADDGYASTDEARLAGLIPAAWKARNQRPACRPDTPRCDFWSWGPAALRPRCCTGHLRDLLFFTDELLTRHGIFHWLDYGPLLGAVRDDGLIAWDYDVDFGVFLEDRHRIAGLAGEIAAAGYRLIMRDDYVWRIHLSDSNHNHADLFPWHRERGRLCLCGPYAGTGEFPPEWLSRMEPVRLFGRNFMAPAPVEEFLQRYRYGADYMTPQRFPDEPTGPQAAVDNFLSWRFLRGLFERNLRALHDALGATALGRRYWLGGQQLLGALGTADKPDWKDLQAGFAFLRADLAAFAAAAAALADAGFEPRWCYRNNAAAATQFSFLKDTARFDFFVLDEEDGNFLSWHYDGGRQRQRRFAAHGSAPLRWLERDWRAPDAEPSGLGGLNGGDGDSNAVAVAPWTRFQDCRFLLSELSGPPVSR